MMKMMREMKQKMPALQEQLNARQFVAQAGGGVVSATVNGKLELVDVKISRELVEGGDVEMLEDLIKVAVSAAQAQAGQAMAEMMEELTGGMNLPGLSSLFGPGQ
ncbi:MAG: YbaB/EbfC family nucleoid-associated protein [Planctomycetes bacterium]|nr:YbaB/EbfC family nucleoid-associated protein [Planctomycetota bacterium]